jgi:hypothetical protein
MTFFSDTTIIIPGATEYTADAVWTAFKWQLNEAVDTDGDTIPDQYDDCPFSANTNQQDSVGNGIGDACRCGDVNNDGLVNVSDSTVLARSLAGLSPYGSVGSMPGFNKCDVNGDGLCNLSDKAIISRSLAALGPGIKQTCAAAVCHSPEVMNGVTCPVLP